MGRKSSASIRLLWRGADLSNAKYILGPWNPSGSHWVLIAADLSEKEIIYLDPMKSGASTSDEYVKKAVEMFFWILHRKFSVRHDSVSLASPHHTLQDDAKSCGVMVCWYAERLIKGESVDSVVNCYGYRRKIYRTITGNCLKDLSRIGLFNPLKQQSARCQKSDEIHWIQCCRCNQ